MHSYQLTFGATQWVKGLNVELNAFYNRTRDLIYMDLIEHFNMGNSDIYGLELSADYESKRFSAHASATWQKDTKYELYGEENIDRAYNMPRFMAKGVLAWQATKHLRLHTQASFCSSQVTRYNNLPAFVKVRTAADALEDLLEAAHVRELTVEEKQTQMMLSEYINATLNDPKALYVERYVNPYFILNMGANYTIDRFEFSFNVNNLLNRSYSISGACTGLIPQQGRWFMGSVAVKL